MLPLVSGLCVICADGKPKKLINGVCQMHYWAAIRQKSRVLVRATRLVRNPKLPDIADDFQEEWYRRQVAGMAGFCWECDAKIATWNYKFAKAAIAHILPKEHFPSIETHELNFLVLGTSCGCHRRWDNSWQKAETMKVAAAAIERFKIFYPEIALAERKRIPEFLLASSTKLGSGASLSE